MYVDDMDLLHQAESPEDKDEELTESVQRDIKVWFLINEKKNITVREGNCLFVSLPGPPPPLCAQVWKQLFFSSS